MHKIAIIALSGMLLIGFGSASAKHGAPKTGKENGWLSLISVIISFTLLYLGGFYNNF